MAEQGILDNDRLGEGMVIVAGYTGSGKSTLIAGMTVARLIDSNGHHGIVEWAAPIEFLTDPQNCAEALRFGNKESYSNG